MTVHYRSAPSTASGRSSSVPAAQPLPLDLPAGCGLERVTLIFPAAGEWAESPGACPLSRVLSPDPEISDPEIRIAQAVAARPGVAQPIGLVDDFIWRFEDLFDAVDPRESRVAAAVKNRADDAAEETEFWLEPWDAESVWGGMPAASALAEAPTSLMSAVVPRVPMDQWSDSLQSVLNQPPAALPRYLILGGFAFACSLGAWSWFGEMQEVSYAQGRLIPLGNAYKAQPVISGEVSEILVKEGQTVKAGQVIAKLDRQVAETEVERLQQSLSALQNQLRQTRHLIDRTRIDIRAQRSIAEADLQAQQAAIAEAQANADTYESLVTKFDTEVGAYQSRLDRLNVLRDEGAIATEYLFDAEQSLRDRQRAVTENQGRYQQALAQVQQLNARLAQKRAEAKSRELEAQQQLNRLEIEAADLQAKINEANTLIKAAQAKLNQMQLYSPVDGIISSLNIDNVGEVAQPGQTLAEIAPAKAPLILSALLRSQDAGLVKVGMPVQMKFDAFPFQDYGLVSGQVLSISPDAKQQEQMGTVYSAYEVEIALDRHSVKHDGQNVLFKAGQTATAEIVIRQRRILDLLLDPIRQLQKGGLNV